ncbi:cell wall hydrolase [Staphylospora marina]|uniref:cell wall hydrolase n=1 Tax=Staphylospora marina TaxID=2490858 RepID=UPI000F5BBE5B|nr:cell wall hydrolase [Staphylospora marina]
MKVMRQAVFLLLVSALTVCVITPATEWAEARGSLAQPKKGAPADPVEVLNAQAQGGRILHALDNHPGQRFHHPYIHDVLLQSGTDHAFVMVKSPARRSDIRARNMNRSAAKATVKKATAAKTSRKSAAVSGVRRSDLELLARAVYGEARGESFRGQVAVAAVVLNRVKNPGFPNSIRGVIYQDGAFTAVDDGQIRLKPNKTAYEAARRALAGEDPTHGAVYYFNPEIATSKWMFNRAKNRKTVRIGRHVFLK